MDKNIVPRKNCDNMTIKDKAALFLSTNYKKKCDIYSTQYIYQGPYLLVGLILRNLQ